jgi:hypothetical protein
MRVLALSSIAVLLLFGPLVARANTCTAAGHPACSIKCPDHQGCAAIFREPEGPCKTACYPAPKGGKTGVVGANSSSPVTSWPSQNHQNNGLPPPGRSFQSNTGGQTMLGTPCRSEAYDKEEAEKFCKQQLNCDVNCTGTARRWICRCK